MLLYISRQKRSSVSVYLNPCKLPMNTVVTMINKKKGVSSPFCHTVRSNAAVSLLLLIHAAYAYTSVWQTYIDLDYVTLL